MKSAYKRPGLGDVARIIAAHLGGFADVRWFENPTDGEKSMLFGNRETPGPKKEGRPRRERAPLYVYIALYFLILFLLHFFSIAHAEQHIVSEQEVPSPPSANFTGRYRHCTYESGASVDCDPQPGDAISDQEFRSDDYQQTLAIVVRACPQVAQEHLHAREMLCACSRELNEQTAALCRRGEGNDYACGAMRAACRGLK